MFFIGDVYQNPSPPPQIHGLRNHGLRKNEFHKPNPKPNPKPPNIYFHLHYCYTHKFCNTKFYFCITRRWYVVDVIKVFLLMSI